MSMTETAVRPARSTPTLLGLLGHIAVIAKLRVGISIAFSALVGVFVTPGPLPSAGAVTLLTLGVLISAAASGAFNHYYEADLDSRMDRTRGRPFVTGALPRSPLWMLVFAAVLAGGVALTAWAGNAVAALYTFLGAFTYTVIYTLWLKRRSPMNIVIGGAAGSFAVLAGAAAVDPHGLHVVPLALAITLFLWTPSHFWSLAIALREQYAAAGFPMLPVTIGEERAARVVLLNTIALVGISLLPAFFGLGPVYLIGAALGGGMLLYRVVAMNRRLSRKTAMAAFYASLAQLVFMFSAAIVDAQISL